MTDGRYGRVPDEFVNIEAAKELGCSYFELMEQPSRYRNLAIAKISQERKAERDLHERSKRNQKSRRK